MPYWYGTSASTGSGGSTTVTTYTITTSTYNQPVVQQQRTIAGHTAEAKDRAQALLLEHLTPAQRETFDRNKWFVVEGGKTGRQYRIRDLGHLVANIDVLNAEGKKDYRLCGHAAERAVPMGDQLLAQKLMLENAEEDFLRLANRHAA